MRWPSAGDVDIVEVSSMANVVGCSLAIQLALDRREGSPQGHFLGSFVLVAVAAAATAWAESTGDGGGCCGAGGIHRVVGTFVRLSVAGTNLKRARALKLSMPLQGGCLICVSQSLGHMLRLQDQQTWFVTIAIPLAHFCSELASLAGSPPSVNADHQGGLSLSHADALLLSNGAVSVVLWCLMDWNARWLGLLGGGSTDSHHHRRPSLMSRLWAWLFSPEVAEAEAARDAARKEWVLVRAALLFASLLFISLAMRPRSLGGRPRAGGVAASASICLLGTLLYVAGTEGIAGGILGARNLLLFDETNASLLVAWLGAVACTIPGLLALARSKAVSNIVLRKLFHVPALAVFASAFLADSPGRQGEVGGRAVPMLRLCSAGVLCVLMLCEFARLRLQGTGVASALTKFFRTFTDDRDSGGFILSHLSLILGLAAPIWIDAGLPRSNWPPLCSGMLAVGVADVLGALVGKAVGSVAICEGSRKTLEGTCAAISGTIACALAWDRAGGGLVSRQGELGFGTFALLCSSACLLEAFTLQLDNLYVPLYLYAVLLLGTLPGAAALAA